MGRNALCAQLPPNTAAAAAATWQTKRHWGSISRRGESEERASERAQMDPCMGTSPVEMNRRKPIDRVGFSCLLLKRRGLATGSLFWGDWLLHHMPWSSSLQTAHYIQNCRHSIRPPPLRFNNKQLELTRSIEYSVAAAGNYVLKQ